MSSNSTTKVVNAARAVNAGWRSRWRAGRDAGARRSPRPDATLVLTKRFGVDVPDPAVDQLSEALQELFAPEVEGEGHGSASLRLGGDRGPAFVIEVSFTGRVVFERWADAGFADELAPRREGAVCSLEEALDLWRLLAAGDLDALEAWRWEA